MMCAAAKLYEALRKLLEEVVSGMECREGVELMITNWCDCDDHKAVAAAYAAIAEYKEDLPKCQVK